RRAGADPAARDVARALGAEGRRQAGNHHGQGTAGRRGDRGWRRHHHCRRQPPAGRPPRACRRRSAVGARAHPRRDPVRPALTAATAGVDAVVALGNAYAALPAHLAVAWGAGFFAAIYLLLCGGNWLLTQYLLPALGWGRRIDP